MVLCVFVCPVAAPAAVLPASPQILLDTTPPASSGALIVVGAGGSFQAALNAAQLGDTITLQAGAVYTGSFTLPAKSGSGWITVRTSAPDSSLPAYGRRITPAYGAALPRLVTPDTSPVLVTAPGAHHYRFVGIEITLAPTVSMHYGLVAIGDGSSRQNTLAQVPYAITFDRVYVHGNATANLVRGISLNGASIAVVNSYLSDIHYAGLDSQALAGWNGPGPFTIVNNYLEAAGENILFGGADPSIANLVPSDIEVRGNHLHKPVAWRQAAWTVKNLFELKNARRVLVDGNLFENNWLQAQNGFAILFTVRNQDGSAPWSTVSDVAFTHNVVRHAGSGVNVLGLDDIRTSQRAQRILIQHNLFEDVSGATWGGSGRLFQLLNGAESVTIDHNTGFQSGEFIVAAQSPQLAFTFTNNLVPNNQYGLIGDGCIGSGCLATFLPDAVIARNGIIAGHAGTYPADNLFPVNAAAVGFTDLSGGVYQLSAASPYRSSGTDGRDLGVDWPALTTAVSGVISGVAPGSAAAPSDTTAPAVAITAPASSATVAGSVTVSAMATDASGIVRVVIQLDGTSGTTLTSAPYQLVWDSTTASNGAHTLVATATDGAGNVSTSAPVTVTVSNAVVLSTPIVSSVTATSAVIGWSTSAPADDQVQYGPTTAYGLLTSLGTALVTAHSRTLTGLAPATLYHVRAVSQGAGGPSVASADLTFTTAAAAGTTTTTTTPTTSAPAGAVTWTALVNVTVSGGTLQKTAGCNGCQDAGAVSSQALASGDGYVEFTLGQLTTQRAIGLSRGNAGTTQGEILFALVAQPSGYVEVREGGVYRAEAAGAATDTFRIAVASGRVTYAKNGTVFYTSAATPVYPLLVDTAFLTSGGTLTNVMFSTGTAMAAANVPASLLLHGLLLEDGFAQFALAEIFGSEVLAPMALLGAPQGAYWAGTAAGASDRLRVAVTAGQAAFAMNGAWAGTLTGAAGSPSE